MKPLTQALPGKISFIHQVNGKADFRQHLENLGFVTGGDVTVITETDGNLVVNVKESRIAISRETAGQIMIDDQKTDGTQTLKTVPCGVTVRVRRIGGGGAVKRRIMDMGITKGVEIHVRKLAPLGDPVEVTVRGYELSLRKADAELIEVE
jgi:ferrous iron transport protein A